MKCKTPIRYAVLCAAPLLAGCAGIWRPFAANVPSSQDKAGSAHVAVLSIAPWEEYVAALQPTFPMDETRALSEAIPNTLGVDRRTSDALSAGLKVALPTTATTATSQTSNAAAATAITTGGATVDTASSRSATESSETRAQQPGLVSGVSDIVIPRAGDPARPTANILDAALSIDPFVRYNVATSLFQEVRMLQRYVRDAIIGTNQRGYVVRLQVTLMPAKRDLRMDAYSTLSFFGAGTGKGNAPTKGMFQLLSIPDSDQPVGGRVRVVPILVADNLEGAAESSSEARLRELSLGLLGAISNAGLSGNAARSLSRLETMLGRRLNSLMTVGQLSDNSVRVRFGGMNQPGSEPVLVPRNQTVTLLVITDDSTVPIGIRVVSKTDFVNAENGELLKPQTRHALYERVDDALKNYGISGVSESSPEVAAMIAAVQDADPSRFRSALQKLVAGNNTSGELADRYRESIWMDVATIVSTLPYSVTTTPLPQLGTSPSPDSEMPALALDDGKRLSVTLVNRVHTRRRESNARLRVDDSDAQLVASSIIVDESGRLTLIFPTISGSGLCSVTPKPGEVACKVTTLTMCYPQQRWEVTAPDCNKFPVAYRVVKEQKPTNASVFTLASTARTITYAANGTAELGFAITKQDTTAKDAKYTVRIEGAEIRSMSARDAGGAVVQPGVKGGAYEFTKSVSILLQLANVHESERVAIIGVSGEKTDRIDFRAVLAPKAR